MLTSEMDNELLKQKIANGRRWLALHAQQPGKDVDFENNPYNDAVWQKNLKFYESLCDEIRRRGIDESVLLPDDKLIENEKKIRTNLHAPEYGGYNVAYSKWFLLRDEMVKRKLCPFFVPSKNEW